MEAFHISPATWFVLLAALLVFAAPSAAQSALRHIWAVDDGEKVFRDDIDSPLKTGEHNSIWDGKTVRLFAARNEIVAFQVILEAGDGTAKDVDVLVTDLTNGESAIRGSHPLPRPDSSIGADVELFTEHYLHITVPSWHSQTDKGWYTTTAASPDLAGWIPDALILLSAKPGRGGAPFEIAPNTNQGIWVDIYVPKDLPAGLYVGHIQITAEGAPAARIAVELEVLEFTLPDENHYRSMIYYSPQNIAARHGLTLGPELVEMVLRYHRMAHRHRLELCGRGAWEEAEALKETLTGSAFTLENGYRGPGEGVGNTVFSINTYGERLPEEESGYRTLSNRWVTWFEENAPDVEYFLYLIDEPKPSDGEIVKWIRERAEWIHRNPGPGGRLPVFVTVQPHEVLTGAVDIWCTVSSRYPFQAVEAAKQRGERVWLYCGIRPFTPTDMIDEHGVSFRLKPWIAHKHGIPRWFTWESTHWYPNHNERPNNRPKNIFADPATFTNGTPEGTGNGDGNLFYPGEDRVFPEQDRGVGGPLGSIRLKMYRRGVQDVEYMWLAEQAGHGEEVEKLISGIYPNDMWSPSGVPPWPTRNADYERARRELAKLITEP